MINEIYVRKPGVKENFHQPNRGYIFFKNPKETIILICERLHIFPLGLETKKE